MNSQKPLDSHQEHDFPLPDFLGVSPDEGPERLPERPWLDLCYVIGELDKKFPDRIPQPTDTQIRKFLQAYNTLSEEAWSWAIKKFLNDVFAFNTPLEELWPTLIFYLDPEPDTIKKKQSVTAPAKEKKQAAPSRSFLLLLSHIQKHAPTRSYELVYKKIHAHTFNKLSKKGKKVYPYGQRFACIESSLPLRIRKNGHIVPGRTFERIWRWLKKRGILNKRSNENQEAKTCATWYVCTSLEQVGHFKSQTQHPRKRAR